MQNSPARATIDVGSVIAGTYTIEALIGRGGMGSVFLASHARLPGKKVAIKVLLAEMTGDEVLARFKREAQIASMLSHPNIVHIEDYNVTPEGTPYLVLEYLEGESLAQCIKRGPLSPEHAFSIVRQVGSALAAAHQKGIVHRDLKPQNIFLVPSEIEGRAIEIAKVLDFGISKMRDSQTVKTQDSALLGTPQYMAPEQATGQHANVDERTDVFALGAIVYEMLSGHPAFSGASIPEVVFKVVYEQPTELASAVPSLPAQIATAVHRAMSKPSTERYSTVSQFVEALTGQPLPPPRSGNSLPPPDVGFANGSKLKDSGADGFAKTVGSGDHSGAAHPVPPPTATEEPKSVRGSAPTLSTNSGQPVAELAPTENATPTKKSRAGLFVGAALALAAIGALVMYFVMHTTDKPQPAEKQQVAQESKELGTSAGSSASASGSATAVAMGSSASADSATTGETKAGETKASETKAGETKSGETKTGETKEAETKSGATIAETKAADAKKAAETKAADAKTADAKKAADAKAADAKKKTTADPIAEVEAEADAAGDATAAAKLTEADAAVKASDWSRAEQLANAVVNSEDATPKQKARALATHGIVQCLGRNNEESALGDLRRIKNALPRARLLKTCQKAGFLLAEH